MTNHIDERANAEINMAATLAGGAGAANPIPLVGDVGILVMTWAGLLFRMAKLYGVEFDERAFRILAKEALRSVGIYAAGTLFFIGITKYTGVGTVPAAAANFALNFAFTKAVGHLYQNAWKQGKEIDLDDLKEVIFSEFDAWKKDQKNG